MGDRVPDTIQLMEIRNEGFESRYVDSNTCMECGKHYDYEMICPDPMGNGPVICIECLGFDPYSPSFIKEALKDSQK